MIEELRSEDIEEAAKVYNKGLQMQIPEGYATLEETMSHLRNVKVFVYKEDHKIKGLVSFKLYKNRIRMDFICALELRKGIGTKLMVKLADFAIRNNIEVITSIVSSKDERVMNFYKSCGFKRYAKYLMREDFLLYRIKAKPEWIIQSITR